MHVDTTKELTSLSLCSGYGGLDLGLHRAIGTTRTLCYVEIESFAIYNMVKKIEEGHMPCAPIYTDLKTFNWRLFNKKVDIITGGFPCQPFSDSGRKRADSDPRHLWPYIYRGLKELDRPPLVFLENVTGIISSKLKGDEWADPAGISVLHHVLRELERLGYQTEASIFSAAEIGAPHHRQRVFILACRSDLSKGGRELINSRLHNTDRKHTLYPAGRGEQQHAWEAPRVLEDTHNRNTSERAWLHKTIFKRQNEDQKSFWTRSTSDRAAGGQILESEMDRAANGLACRVGDAKLLRAYDNKKDELRLLGNGVVPQTAEKAFRELWARL